MSAPGTTGSGGVGDTDWDRGGSAGGYGLDVEHEYIVVGDEPVFVSDIAAFRVEDVVERDLSGLIASAGLTLNFAAVILVGVTAFGWRSQFLIAVVLFFVLGVGSVLELFKSGRSAYQKLTLFVEGGDPIEFCCADEPHVLELVQNLNSRGIGAV